MKKLKFLSLTVFFLIGKAHARNLHPEIHSALSFIQASQITQEGDFYRGQWSNYVTSILFPSIVGVGTWGHPYAEPTAFNTASVANLLADMYFADRGLKEIPPMMDKAVASFPRYYVGPLVDFYPPKTVHGALIHNPRRMKLGRLFVGFANVPADADSTSVTYTALNNHRLMHEGYTHREAAYPVPGAVYENFSRFRDLHRKPHFYDRYYGNFDTGAYVTWLMDEKDPSMPGSVAAPGKGPRIPFGINDVDCVVNANVLKLMTVMRHTSDPGYKESCDFLRAIIEKDQTGVCGLYYPNKYQAAMEFARLKEMGPSCLADEDETLLAVVLGTQKDNGSWESGPPNRYDTIQSTATALNTLLILGNPRNSQHRQSVEKAVEYLLNHSQRDAQGRIYWNGQVFFSAVAQARFSIVWRSTPYTTALVAKALLLAERF